MKAVVFYRKNGRPDSRMLEDDKDFDGLVKRITAENEEADLSGLWAMPKRAPGSGKGLRTSHGESRGA
jgi:hypothetical protein